MTTETVATIVESLKSASAGELPRLIRRYSTDDRSGVRSSVARARKKLAAIRKEAERLATLGELESSLRSQGVTHVAGIDEVGRGALAGPVTAAAVILPPEALIDGLDDSKRLTPERREELAVVIREVSVAFHVAHVDADQVDSIGIGPATRRAMKLALDALEPAAEHVIVDGHGVGLGIPETSVVKGDSSVACVAAASILAKVCRDGLMRRYAQEHPVFGFEINKGYGTSEHMMALTEHGLCPLHRKSFSPCGGSLRLF